MLSRFRLGRRRPVSEIITVKVIAEEDEETESVICKRVEHHHRQHPYLHTPSPSTSSASLVSSAESSSCSSPCTPPLSVKGKEKEILITTTTSLTMPFVPLLSRPLLFDLRSPDRRRFTTISCSSRSSSSSQASSLSSEANENSQEEPETTLANSPIDSFTLNSSQASCSSTSELSHTPREESDIPSIPFASDSPTSLVRCISWGSASFANSDLDHKQISRRRSRFIYPSSSTDRPATPAPLISRTSTPLCGMCYVPSAGTIYQCSQCQLAQCQSCYSEASEEGAAVGMRMARCSKCERCWCGSCSKGDPWRYFVDGTTEDRICPGCQEGKVKVKIRDGGGGEDKLSDSGYAVVSLSYFGKL